MLVEVTAGLIEKDDKILIARRKEDKHLAGFWEFPGGKIENNETPEDCLKRELFEEFSIITEVCEFVAETIYKHSTKTIKLIAFIVKVLEGDFILKDHDNIKWVDLEEIKKYKLAPADIQILKEYEYQRINRKNNCF